MSVKFVEIVVWLCSHVPPVCCMKGLCLDWAWSCEANGVAYQMTNCFNDFGSLPKGRLKNRLSLC